MYRHICRELFYRLKEKDTSVFLTGAFRQKKCATHLKMAVRHFLRTHFSSVFGKILMRLNVCTFCSVGAFFFFKLFFSACNSAFFSFYCLVGKHPTYEQGLWRVKTFLWELGNDDMQ